jgi:N-acetylmuramoyl-L-alanine amidase
MNSRAFNFLILVLTLVFIFTLRVFSAGASTMPPSVDVSGETRHVVIIDAGHGGGDWGVSARGAQEKAITLDLAKRIKEKIEASDRNITVYLTRTGDDYKSIDDRAGFANSQKGEVYISIHCDYSPSESAGGYKVYYMSGAQMSRQPGAGLVKWDEAQLYHTDDSARLAGYIIQYMKAALIPEASKNDENDLLPSVSRGQRAIKSSVLASLDMAAVELETGNLANNADFTNLKDPRILNQMAYHIKEAIVNYLKETGSGGGTVK